MGHSRVAGEAKGYHLLVGDPKECSWVPPTNGKWKCFFGASDRISISE
jgi:hypothetical protein